MRLSRYEITIRSLMIAVVAASCLLALLKGFGLIVISLSFSCLAWVGALCLLLRGQQHFPVFGFWAPAALINVSYSAACIAPESYLLVALYLGWMVIAGPAIGALGAYWVRSVTCEHATPRRSAPAAWLAVIALSGMPLLTLWTMWPLRLAFFASRPSLERLADQVAAGQVSGFPRWSGLFRIAGSAVEPTTGNVGLMIEPNPNGPIGFVRTNPANLQNRAGPFRGGELYVDLGSGWDYREED